jgi:hypothetical protein
MQFPGPTLNGGMTSLRLTGNAATPMNRSSINSYSRLKLSAEQYVAYWLTPIEVLLIMSIRLDLSQSVPSDITVQRLLWD